jgi:hypothetical protein
MQPIRMDPETSLRSWRKTLDLSLGKAARQVGCKVLMA